MMAANENEFVGWSFGSVPLLRITVCAWAQIQRETRKTVLIPLNYKTYNETPAVVLTGRDQPSRGEESQIERNGQSLIQALQLLGRESADKIGQSGLGKTHQFIAMYAALVFHALFNSN